MRQLMRHGSVTTQHLARILAMPVTFDTAKVFRTTGTLIENIDHLHWKVHTNLHLTICE